MVFSRSEQEWKDLGAYWTSKEIYQQPETWLKTLNQIKTEKDAIKAFINQVKSNPDFDIILTGAGTSEFVGNSIFPYLLPINDFKVKSYGTTDIVASPETYLSKTKPTLLISFARSGNSPESVAAVEAANKVCKTVYHLFVTCNIDGALSKFAKGKSNCYAINLTPETHDQSFAMTSSYSNMYLATILSFEIDHLDEMEKAIKEIAANTQSMFDGPQAKELENLANTFNFSRIVYLGSNSLKGVSQESALKICELTAGKVNTTFDSTMGFRHGPKSVINSETLAIVYLSDDPYTRKYDTDIIKEMSPERNGNQIIAVSSKEDNEVKGLCDHFICFNNKNNYKNALLGLEYITVAQVIALFKSINLGIKPDTPCPSGTVNRVVKGVIIYPYSC